MTQYSKELGIKKYVKGYGFLSFARNLSYKSGKQLLEIAARTRLDALKTFSIKVVHKATEATGEFIGKKML